MHNGKTISEKIGIGIVTYNSESYFETLYNSIYPMEGVELVVVNGGSPYEGSYDAAWIQHTTNKYPATCRNECVQHLLQQGCEHIFIIEDDMVIKDKAIFDRYIRASKCSGLKYFSFVSMSYDSGTPKARTPRLTVEYKNNTKVSFYKNMCNEFTYHHKTAFEINGMYDTTFRDPFDIDMAYRESKQDYCSPFWWFADISDSDLYIENNPVATSRLQGERPDGSRQQRIQEQWQLFHQKHGLYVNNIPDTDRAAVINFLKTIKNDEQTENQAKRGCIENLEIGCVNDANLKSADSAKNCSLFIPVAPKDEIKLHHVVEYALKHTQCKTVFVCSPHNIRNKIQDSNISYINDADVLDIPDRSFIGFRPNWTYQQFLKMFFSFSVGDYYFALDSDTIILKPLELFTSDNRPIWYYGWEQNHLPYFLFNEKNFKLSKTLKHTGIGDMGLFNKKISKSFLDKLGAQNAKELLLRIGKNTNQFFHFSEYETYANYVHQSYPGLYTFKQLKQANMGRNIDAGQKWTSAEILQEITKAQTTDNHTLSIHSWMV